MTKLPQDSSAGSANNASDGPIDEGDPIPAGTSEPPLELVLAPKRSDARRRFAYIGASVAAALMIGYLSGSSAGWKNMLGVGVRIEQAEPLQALPPKSEVTTDARDKQEIARLVNEINSLRAQIEQVRHSADNLHASERLARPRSSSGTKRWSWQDECDRTSKTGQDRNAPHAIGARHARSHNGTFSSRNR